MKVKFRYDFEDIHKSEIKEIQSAASEEDIISMYPVVMHGQEYGIFSSYEIIQEGD